MTSPLSLTAHCAQRAEDAEAAAVASPSPGTTVARSGAVRAAAMGPALAATSTSLPAGPCYVAVPPASGHAVDPVAVEPASRGYAQAGLVASASGGSGEANATTKAATKGKAATTATGKGAASTSSAGKSAAVTASASKGAAATSSKSAAVTTSASKSDLAFLDDASLSVEDKLYRFMVLMTKKEDQELEAAMKSYADRKAVATKAQSDSGGGLLGVVGDVAGGLGSALAKVAGGDLGGALTAVTGGLGGALGDVAGAVVKGAEGLAKDLGGPLLAAAVTAAGLPALAPAALAVGGALGKALVDGVAIATGLKGTSTKNASGSSGALQTPSSGSTSASTSTAASTSKAATTSTAAATSAASGTTVGATADDFDEKLEMFGLQRLVEKGNALFAALSNAMKSMHDTQLAVVANIR